jgi:DNA gyrase/topoisomerase IV subunit B
MPEKQTIKQVSQREHVLNKTMWTGSKSNQVQSMYVLNGDQFVTEKIKFPPVLLKIIDEIVVNSIDHHTNHPAEVKNLYVSFRDGLISVMNDGPGFKIEKTKNLNGEVMYSPQLASTEFQAGTNLDEGEKKRFTGGTNGAGMTLTNVYSKKFILRTNDGSLYYQQTSENNMEIINKPLIANIEAGKIQSFVENAATLGSPNIKFKTIRDIGNLEILGSKILPSVWKKEWTSIEFLPDYKRMQFTSSDFKSLEKLIIARVYQAFAFTEINTFYNGEKIKFPGPPKKQHFYKFARMFVNHVINCKIISKSDDGSRWNLCVGISDGAARQISLINGIWVYNGGNHIKHFRQQITNYILPKLNKIKTKGNMTERKLANMISNNTFIFARGRTDSPEFSSQIKDTLSDPISKFAKYKIKISDLKLIFEIVEPCIMMNYIEKATKNKTTTVSNNINVLKCVDAKYAGGRKREQTTLIICEGDSAVGTVHEGITNRKTELNYNYYGTFSIGGVPMNAMKKCKSIINPLTKKKVILRDAALDNNERLTSLSKVLNLNYGFKYNTDKERKTLRYGSIVVAVDQDDDGKGNIFGLIIAFFMQFWPHLIALGFIKRFNTPIIRAYPKVNKKLFIEEFYSLAKFQNWITKLGEKEMKRCSKADKKTLEAAALMSTTEMGNKFITKTYNVKYYKGLGSHQRNEVSFMFSDFNKKLINYNFDCDAVLTTHIYFGTDPETRKKALATPVTQHLEGLLINISDQLNVDTKDYQRDNIFRKLPHLVDGQVPSRRKLLKAAGDKFGTTKSTNKEMKVNSFASFTSSSMGYHHGEHSLEEVLVKMGQNYPGAKNLSFFMPRGQFGTRSQGGKDHASSRYIYTNLNQRLYWQVFPKQDLCLLKYVFDEGERAEPEYFVPIIPLAIMENMSLPAHGWATTLWARNWEDVFNNIYDLIYGKIKKSRPMRLWMRNNNCSIRQVDGKPYMVGKYEYYSDTDEILITELPVSVCSAQYIGDVAKPKKRDLCGRPEFEGPPLDSTNNEDVNILFKLNEGAIDNIKNNYGNVNFDPMEHFMNLKLAVNDNINLIDEKKRVIEFTTYTDVLDCWFVIRKQLYADRIDRNIAIAGLMIIYLENIIRFTNNYENYNINPKSNPEKVCEILEKNKYEKIWKARLLNPQYTQCDKLNDLILKGDASSYNYLIDLKCSDMLQPADLKRKKELEEYKTRLQELKKDCGAIYKGEKLMKGGLAWIRELDDLKVTIQLGLDKGWDYGEGNGNFKRRA